MSDSREIARLETDLANALLLVDALHGKLSAAQAKVDAKSNKKATKTCREGGPHRVAVSGLTGLAWCKDCSWDEGD